MKRAPIIPRSSTSSASPLSASAPTAPMVDSLISRVGAMAKGNTIVLPVCGRDVKFVLETVPANIVESTTHVWPGNERVQEFLTREALDDLIPSFVLNGQQNPAFGRRINDSIQVADGSRRRMTSILTSSDYRILLGDLDDEQMDSLCKLGNDYRPTSAYERGRRYSLRLDNEFNGSISALAEGEHISRKIITRCINTSKLPHAVITLFSHPGELSARAGDHLYKLFLGNEKLLIKQSEELSVKQKSDGRLESDNIIEELASALKSLSESNKFSVEKRNFGPGATAQYRGNKVIFNLDRTKIPHDLIEQFEEMLEKLKSVKH